MTLAERFEQQQPVVIDWLRRQHWGADALALQVHHNPYLVAILHEYIEREQALQAAA
ncbi:MULTISPECIES: hypothetical protein [Pseudomonadaceae]|uniref:hypothetical protein n=1 Tax=Pseudomonadaceae TaxID=135621 RepID=UPI0015E0852E|nr:MULTISPECIES: hypothetical protein [Pseudomonadaceae]MCQ4325767.1 hypothetical protein [Stutzerimonas stutzeri]UIP88222.1 hypothetical protein HU825_17390 [Pseudomonas phenolilytica]